MRYSTDNIINDDIDKHYGDDRIQIAAYIRGWMEINCTPCYGYRVLLR